MIYIYVNIASRMGLRLCNESIKLGDIRIGKGKVEDIGNDCC